MKSKLIIIFLASIFAYSCHYSPYDICNYEGKQIVEKGESEAGYHYFKIRNDGMITNRIYITEYDWNCYNEGDFIKCK